MTRRLSMFDDVWIDRPRGRPPRTWIDVTEVFVSVGRSASGLQETFLGEPLSWPNFW